MYRNISCRQVVAPNFSIVQVNICGPFTGATRDRPPCWRTEGGLFYFSCIGEEIRLSSAAGVVAPQMNQFPFEAAEEVCCKDSPCGPCSGGFSGWPVTEGRGGILDVPVAVED